MIAAGACVANNLRVDSGRRSIACTIRSSTLSLSGARSIAATAEEAFFDFVYQPLFDDQAQVSGIAIVAFDVTELTNARRDAEAANRTKDEYERAL